ncbi:MAG: hypothetical protein HY425_01535 [Candidatus Levybacteria bacterium]|nr:hypothetical protein [Candidatus Levybacteria bacterium]
MLTKTDLNQIRGVVHEEVDIIVEEKLESKLKPIREELSLAGQVIDEKLDSKLKPIRKDLRYLRTTVDIIVKNYDEADVKLHRRVRRIEHHLALPEDN